jgi:type IV secretory pathway VirB10-like protein
MIDDQQQPEPSAQPRTGSTAPAAPTTSRATRFARMTGTNPAAIAAVIVACFIGSVGILWYIVGQHGVKQTTSSTVAASQADVAPANAPAGTTDSTPAITIPQPPELSPTPVANARYPFGPAAGGPRAGGSPAAQCAPAGPSAATLPIAAQPVPGAAQPAPCTAPSAPLTVQPTPGPPPPPRPPVQLPPAQLPPPIRSATPAPPTPGGFRSVPTDTTPPASRVAFGSAADVPAIAPEATDAQRAPVAQPPAAENDVAPEPAARTAAFAPTAPVASSALQAGGAAPATGGGGYVPPTTPTQLTPTTVITARLISKIVSTLPGPFTAQVTTNVYDSATHQRLVIPAGTKIKGSSDYVVVDGQNRLLAVAARFVFPDGREFDFGREPITDAQGAVGMTGDVDPHRSFAPAFVLVALGAAEAAIAPNPGGSIGTAPTAGDQARTAAGQQINGVGNVLVNQTLQRKPTIIIRKPDTFHIIATRDLALDEYAVRE